MTYAMNLLPDGGCFNHRSNRSRSPKAPVKNLDATGRRLTDLLYHAMLGDGVMGSHGDGTKSEPKWRSHPLKMDGSRGFLDIHGT